ncbi:hypothetical protein ACGLFO_09895, partial [Corynebacterium hesseae]|uniref:hypothetical protein n=1 Tax=Corynebacterium hesseae TaxID=2913502 RepID=UPI00373E22DC
MRIHQHAVALVDILNGGKAVGVGRGTRQEAVLGAGSVERLLVDVEPAFLHFRSKQLLNVCGIAAKQVKGEALEVRGAGNIHRRRGRLVRLLRGARAVAAGAEELIKHVILIGCDDEFVDGQAHLAGDVAGADITEVAGGHAEGDLLGVLRGDLEVAIDVVDHLRHEAGPV